MKRMAARRWRRWKTETRKRGGRGDAQKRDDDCGDGEARVNGGTSNIHSVRMLKMSAAVVVTLTVSGAVAGL